MAKAADNRLISRSVSGVSVATVVRVLKQPPARCVRRRRRRVYDAATEIESDRTRGRADCEQRVAARKLAEAARLPACSGAMMLFYARFRPGDRRTGGQRDRSGVAALQARAQHFAKLQLAPDEHRCRGCAGWQRSREATAGRPAFGPIQTSRRRGNAVSR
ncbi:hypothetical protein ACVOMV_08055 [Mesorhizobium atlanticum]